MPNILITGSNRGIGLEVARQYAHQGWRVYATCRHPSDARTLRDICAENRNLSIHRLDVTVPEDIQAIRSELRDVPLDVLFNNAGIYLEQDYDAPALGAIRYDQWLRTIEVNTFGAVRMTEALLSNLARGERRLAAVMTSHMGSIGDIHSGGSYYYRTSKAALNAAMRGLSFALRPHGVGVLLLHPGAVSTRMGPDDGILPEESVRGLRQIIENFSLPDSGAFIRYDGKPMPW